MKRFTIIRFWLLGLMLYSCSPAQAVTINTTPTPNPATSTPIPPSETPTQTLTPTITPTITATATTTFTSTPTVEPHKLAITVQNAQEVVLLKEFGKNRPHYVAWSPNGAYIATANYSEVTIYSPDSLEVIQTIDPDYRIESIAFGPDPYKLFIIDLYIHEWDLITGQEIDTHGYLEGGIRNFAISENGKVIAYSGPAWGGGGDPDYVLAIRNIETERSIFYRQAYGGVGPVAVSADGNWAAASGEYGLEIFDAVTGELIQLIKPAGSYLTFGTDGQTLIQCNNYNCVHIQARDIFTGKVLAEYKRKPDTTFIGICGRDFVYRAPDKSLYLFNIDDLQWTQVLINEYSVYDLSFNPDGTAFAAAASGGLLTWDLASEQATQTLFDFTPLLDFAAFTPDSQAIVGGVDEAPISALPAWNIETGECIEATSIAPHTISHPGRDAVLLSPDGRTSAEVWMDDEYFPTQGSVRLIDTVTGEILYDLVHEVIIGDEGYIGLIKSMAFNGDGSLLVTIGANASVYLWDVQTGKLVKEIAQQTKVNNITFSPDGRYMAASSWDGIVQVWGLPTP